jgi:hypothetical protein
MHFPGGLLVYLFKLGAYQAGQAARLMACVDEKLTAVVELELAIRACEESS